MVLGGHGLFTWGATQRECYVNTLTIIDQIGQFVVGHVEKLGDKFSAARRQRLCPIIVRLRFDCFRSIRGRVSARQRLIGNFNDLPEILRFVNSADAATLARLGTSCPDHFIRTKIRPLFVPWDGDWAASSGFRVTRFGARSNIAATTRSITRRLRCRFAENARRESDRCARSRYRHVQLRQEQDRSPHHRRVLHQCRTRNGRRDGARSIANATRSRVYFRKRDPLRKRKRSKCIRTTSRYRRRKLFESSIGHWKKRKFAVSRRKKN